MDTVVHGFFSDANIANFRVFVKLKRQLFYQSSGRVTLPVYSLIMFLSMMPLLFIFLLYKKWRYKFK